jgi:AraC-like DNA-binding protein
MKDIFFKTYVPNMWLRPYIQSMFILETMSGIPKNEFSLIAPNGSIKLVIPYKNNMRSTIGKKFREHKENSCFFIGLSTQAAIIECDADYGNLCIEFKPFGAYRFFNFSLKEIANQIYNSFELFDRMGRELQERISEITDIDEKVRYAEQFFFKQMLALNKSDPITEFAIHQITSQKGLISINDLSNEMGYSRRYLLNKFKDNVGLSPKEFTNIVRFSEVYKGINQNLLKEDKLYEFYYDQSHYIREFKRYTGLTPGEYVLQSNKLGSVFFNE